MATTSANSLSLASSSTLIDATRQPASVSPQCVSLPTLPPPPVQSHGRLSRAASYCRKVARNVAAMATGDVPAAAAAAPGIVEEGTPEFVKIVKDAWDNIEDKYAVVSLAAAGAVALCATSGMISAIDRLPVVPGLLEIVGIGYTGWFAYKNLVFKPDREQFIKKSVETYNNIIGSSSNY